MPARRDAFEKGTVMRRRDILAGAGSLAAGATLSFPAPALAQGIRQLKMVTDWPESLPGFYPSAVRFAREITSPEAFRGMRYRMPPPGAEVLRRLGAIVVLLPGGEIAPALRSGALDASEFVGPWIDMAIGLHQAVNYYYYPGFHEPGSGIALGINKSVWESFDASDRRVIEAVTAGEYARSLAEFNANNALALRKLRDEGTVKILKFDDSLLKTFFAVSKDVVAEIGAGDELSKKIYASYQQFRASTMDWSDVAERAFLNSRRLA
jgi:TRAP-type mannitol/chloroaromatic compound transport system substrate-binding protein